MTEGAGREPWFAELANAYLSGESSLFVVSGPDRAGIEQELVRELSRTRPIVGVIRPDRGLDFGNLGDLSRFENLVAGRRVLGGLPSLRSDRPLEALGKIWAALEVADPAQAWIVADADRLFPPKTYPEPLGGGAPPLAAWATSPRLRESNHLVVLIAARDRLHPDLAAAARGVDAAPVLRLVHDAAADDEPTPPPPPVPAAVAVPPDLGARLTAALSAALVGWPAAAWPSRAPFMAAVARLIADLPQPPCGPIEIRWDPDAGAVAEGPGADWFLSHWRTDVAIDAACGAIAKGLAPPEEGYAEGAVPALDPVGARVLAKRLERWFSAD